jgi:RNA 2',3'-cyclic 3'-phosphodiesterase
MRSEPLALSGESRARSRSDRSMVDVDFSPRTPTALWHKGQLMTDALRLFVGIDVGGTWTEVLSATAGRMSDALGRSVRWVRPELYHVTVVFLGNQPPDAVGPIGEALTSAAATIESFGLQLTELRRLGGHEHGALVAGVDDASGQLQRFRDRLDAQLISQGIAFDSKRLVPHVTLGRPRGRSGPIQLTPVNLSDASPLAVREVNLVKSDLLPTGPRYETIASARFRERRT